MSYGASEKCQSKDPRDALPLDFRLTISPRACVGPQHMLKQCLSLIS